MGAVNFITLPLHAPFESPSWSYIVAVVVVAFLFFSPTSSFNDVAATENFF